MAFESLKQERATDKHSSTIVIHSLGRVVDIDNAKKENDNQVHNKV